MTNESEIVAFLDRCHAAMEAKDIDGLMSFYAPEIVYYDAVPPLRFRGTEEVRGNFLRWFDGYEGPISLETHDLTILTEGDVAVANMLNLDTGVRKGGLQQSMWVRATTCLHRAGGTWTITHEHISMPINPATLQVWIATDKDELPDRVDADVSRQAG